MGEPFGDSLQDDEGIAYAEIDLSRCVEPKQFHDVVGYYNRFDVFDLTVNRKRLVPAAFLDEVDSLNDRTSTALGIEEVAAKAELNERLDLVRIERDYV